MSLGGAERWGLFGGLLLAGAVIAIAVMSLVPRSEPKKDGRRRSPSADRPGDPPPAQVDPVGEEPPKPARPESFIRERERLQTKILVLEAEVDRLKARLVEAGIPLEEPPPDPKVTTGAALAELRRCGPGTDPGDVEALLDRIVSAGAAGVETVREFLSGGEDVAFSDSWTFLGGRFVGYPSLRTALLSALERIGGVEGQSALLEVLGRTEDPLEICQTIRQLEPVTDVPDVAAARTKAARRYLELAPPRGESLLVRSVLEALLAQEPGAAAESLGAYVRSDRRSAERVETAIRMISGLRTETALPALLLLAADLSLGDKAVRSARILAESGHPGVIESFTEWFSKEEVDPAVRKEVYRMVDLPVSRALEQVARRKPREGLPALAEVDRVEAEIQARMKFLLACGDRERDPTLKRILSSAVSKIERMAETAKAERKRLQGE